MTKTASG